MKKNDLCERCRELVIDAANYDQNNNNSYAELYRKFKAVELRVKQLSHLVEKNATKELIR